MRKILLPPILLLLCIAAMFGMREWLTVTPIGIAELDTVGYVLIFLGIFLPLWGARVFAKHKTNIKPYKDPDTMVMEGPFRFSRNPMYLGMLLVLIGGALKFGFVEALAMPLLFFAVANWWYIPFEEGRMQHMFGDAFEDYRAKVRRWI